MLKNDKIGISAFEDVMNYDIRRKVRNSRPSN